ncbi:MAG TPA: transposase [Saprospiraceae bacterium]|nr:transposase [Saprospiraceae bacterium]
MVSTAFTLGSRLIGTIIRKMGNIGTVQNKFISQILILFLSMRGRHNFLSFGRYGHMDEHSYRYHFKKNFDWIEFNRQYVAENCSDEVIIGFDPSYITKSGKFTHGIGYFYSGCSGKYERGLEIGNFSVIDVKQNTAYHLLATQSKYVKREKSTDDTLMDQYVELLKLTCKTILSISGVLVVDAYFCKNKYITACKDLGIECITRLRDDANLRYKYNGPTKTGKGRRKLYGEKVYFDRLDKRKFNLVHKNSEMKIYTCIANSISLKCDIRVAYVEFLDAKGNIKLTKKFMSTNLDRDGLSIVQYYRARYQMEFVFRDAKQYTGLEHCQARDEEKLNYHFNASLTSVNIAKGIARKGVKKDEEINISISDIKIELSNRLLLDLFISNYGIDPNLQKNRKIYNELLNFGKNAA